MCPYGLRTVFRCQRWFRPQHFVGISHDSTFIRSLLSLLGFLFPFGPFGRLSQLEVLCQSCRERFSWRAQTGVQQNSCCARSYRRFSMKSSYLLVKSVKSPRIPHDEKIDPPFGRWNLKRWIQAQRPKEMRHGYVEWGAHGQDLKGVCGVLQLLQFWCLWNFALQFVWGLFSLQFVLPDVLERKMTQSSLDANWVRPHRLVPAKPDPAWGSSTSEVWPSFDQKLDAPKNDKTEWLRIVYVYCTSIQSIPVSPHAHTHRDTHTYIYIHNYTIIHTYIYIYYVCIYIYTYTSTYIHIYIGIGSYCQYLYRDRHQYLPLLPWYYISYAHTHICIYMFMPLSLSLSL